MKKLPFLLLISTLFFSCSREFAFEQETFNFFHVNVTGTTLPVMVKGNSESRKFVVFVNGGPGLTTLDVVEIDLFGWSEILEKNVAMVYYDPRGTGNAQGDIDPNTITIKESMNDLDAVITVVDQKYPGSEIYIMAHSFGSMISQLYILDPDYDQSRLQGFINIDGTSVADLKVEWVYRRDFLINLSNEMIAKGDDIEKWESALEWTEENPQITTREQKNKWRSFIGNPGDGVIPEEDVSIGGGDVLNLLFASSYNVFPSYTSKNLSKTGKLLAEEIRGTNMLTEVSNITLPTLFIWGRYDDLIPPELGMEVYNAFGTEENKKEFILFEESGHQPFGNEKEKFQNSIIDFIRRYH